MKNIKNTIALLLWGFVITSAEAQQATTAAGGLVADRLNTLGFDSIKYSFTGNIQTFTVPTGITSITIDAYGARGGNTLETRSDGARGGWGGRVQGSRSVAEGETFYLYVGGKGRGDPYFTGGWNGGGKGPISGMSSSNNNFTGGGGGASDIRIAGQTLSERILVTGGGGGASAFLGGSGWESRPGGHGGGLNRAPGEKSLFVLSISSAGGGSQNAGGAGGLISGATPAPSG